ncbi:hypothetical protein [Mycolicibacterium cosmeticum]|uniref:Uncharacterized protein n=1 Tax=Mycolicibacterium cosmeticum TaxID=258533 RepID=W9AZC7_MYCCO|nr:hypothetical protein [Mycolicibacterium cosmeticum]CDO08277.1 hypothetical protein BN977_03096 [Mycolicibacterium cosmeticum]
MAALIDTGAPAWARRALMMLVHAVAREPGQRPPKSRRHYPPRRDIVIEQAAMSREMYRL